MWISKKRYENLISRIERCERKIQTQKLYEEIRSTEKNDKFVEKFIRL